tara:strand:- start:522 stop:1091 length:570 start_codon:yes stop_codon:yes gene_type:complete
MEIDNFIKVYDNVFHFEKVASLVKYASNKAKFKDASVIGDKSNKPDINKNLRNTQTYAFTTDSLSSVHWGQYIRHIIRKAFDMYSQAHRTHAEKIQAIEILKYSEGGFYTVHSDHHGKFPRTVSVIIFLNNDYEGGELNFHNPFNNNEIYKTIKPAPGRCIMWPSNFVYPHSVSKVTKGTRYAIVSWLT